MGNAPLAWTQLLMGVGVGVLIAVALQLLLLLLGSAIALTLLPLPSPHAQPEPDEKTTPDLPLGFLAGMGVLSTVNGVLFVASFLAMTLVPLSQPSSGAIAGIVVWAIYFLLMTWLSLKTLNTWGKTALNLSTAGVRGIVSWVTNAFQPNSDDRPLSPSELKAVIREEVQAAFTTWQPYRPQPRPTDSSPLPATHAAIANPAISAMWQELQQYLRQAHTKKLSPKHLEHTLHQYFDSLPPTHLQGASETLQAAELATVLASRQDLSEKKQTRILDQIQSIWERYTQTATPHATDKPREIAATHPDRAESRTLSFPTAKELQAAVATLNDEILPQLPDVLEQNWETIAPLAAAVTQIDLQDAITPVQSALHQAEHLRDQAASQLSDLQTALQEETQARLETLRQDAITRLTATRRTVTIALWWLFAIALTSSISATLAGAMATGFTLLPQFPPPHL
jgi:hypothetical protein